MKNKTILVLCLFVLAMVSMLFVSCDKENDVTDEDTVEVTVVDYHFARVMSIDQAGETNDVQTPYYPDSKAYVTIHNIRISKGSTYTWQNYMDYRLENGIYLGSFGGRSALGFYTDKGCRIKFDEDTKICDDITLYVDIRDASMTGETSDFCIIVYDYQGKQYRIFRNFNYTLSSEDFTVSAYGKSIDENALEFYWDEDYTIPFDMENSGQIITLKDHWDSCPGELTIYVKQIDVGE